MKETSILTEAIKNWESRCREKENKQETRASFLELRVSNRRQVINFWW